MEAAIRFNIRSFVAEPASFAYLDAIWTGEVRIGSRSLGWGGNDRIAYLDVAWTGEVRTELLILTQRGQGK